MFGRVQRIRCFEVLPMAMDRVYQCSAMEGELLERSSNHGCRQCLAGGREAENSSPRSAHQSIACNHGFNPGRWRQTQENCAFQ